MSDCKSYVSKEDLQALKESQQHIEHVARSRNAAGEKALQVTDSIRGENVTNRTLDGLEDIYNSAIRDMGWITIDSFQQGAEITGRNQALRDETNGEYYRWDGDLPKTVPVGSTPESSGGVGMGAWVSIGDASLRSELHGDDGYKLIPSIQIQQWKDRGDIRGWGAVEGQDCSDALQAAINDRAVKGWGTSSDVIIDGSYRIDKQILIPTDLRLKGNWATIISDMDDYIFVSAYVDDTGKLVSNWDLSDSDAIAKARLKGTTIEGITFVKCSKILKLRNFNERCGLRDLFFEQCGVAFTMVAGFYSFLDNVFIRSSKTGYEDWYAYSLGRMSNLIHLNKVTVSERQYGTFIGNVEPIDNAMQVFYELLTFNQCSWEHVQYPFTIDMKGFSLKINDWYAEVVSGPLFRVLSGDQYDLQISAPSWLAGVENMGEFKNLKGRSEIYQGSQNDYDPPKPASLLIQDSDCTVYKANVYTYGDNINYAGGNVKYVYPVSEKRTDLTNFEVVTNDFGSVANNISKEKNVVSLVGGDLLISTSIKKSAHNMIVCSLDINNYMCGFVSLGDEWLKSYGYTFEQSVSANGNTNILVKGTGLSSVNELILKGSVRFY